MAYCMALYVRALTATCFFFFFFFFFFRGPDEVRPTRLPRGTVRRCPPPKGGCDGPGSKWRTRRAPHYDPLKVAKVGLTILCCVSSEVRLPHCAAARTHESRSFLSSHPPSSERPSDKKRLDRCGGQGDKGHGRFIQHADGLRLSTSCDLAASRLCVRGRERRDV